MARPCSVCRDARRQAIDTAIISGEPYRRIAARQQLPEANVRRHASHLASASSKAARVDLSAEAWHLDLNRHMGAATEAVVSVLREARLNGDLRVQLQACGALQRQCEFFWSIQADQHQRELEARLSALEEALQIRQNGHSREAWPSHV